MDKDQKNTPSSFQIPPDVVELKEKIADAFEPAISRNEKLKIMFRGTSTILPKLVQFEKPTAVKAILEGIDSTSGSWIELDRKMTETLSWWEERRKELEKHVRDFDEVLERAQRILISDDSPLLDWGYFGWTISPGAQIRDYYVRPKTKEEADQIMERIHDENAIHITFEELCRSSFHTEQDIKEVEFLFYEGHYKACALLLFSLIDSVIIHTQDGTEYEGKKRPGGEKGIKRYEELTEPVSWPGLTTRMLSFISSIAALKAFFAKPDDFKSDNPVLNRNLICHGMLLRDVNRTDCVQLSLLYKNMLHFAGDI